MLNDYFRTVDEKLIGPADEIHAHSRQNVDIRTTTSITISQMEIEEKIYKLEVKKAVGPDGVSARHLKYAGLSIAPSLASLNCLNTALMPASHQTSGKLLESVQRSKKDEGKTLHDTEYYLSSGY